MRGSTLTFLDAEVAPGTDKVAAVAVTTHKSERPSCNGKAVSWRRAISQRVTD